MLSESEGCGVKVTRGWCNLNLGRAPDDLTSYSSFAGLAAKAMSLRSTLREAQLVRATKGSMLAFRIANPVALSIGT